MGEENAPTEKTSKKPLNKAKLIVYLIIIVGAGIGVAYNLQKRSGITAYNTIVDEQINQQQYEEAATQLEKMLPGASGDLEAKIKESLVHCYKQIASDPALPMKEAAAYLKKAHDLDPDALSDQEKQMLELGSR